MKKNVAVIGYGGMGSWHARCALESDVVSLKGVYDIKPEKNEKAREAGIYAYESFEAVLADEDVDIIVCATPNDVHKDIVIRALEAGKNAVCEKPVTMSVKDFDQMCETAKRAGKVFSVHQNRRWDGDFLAIKELIESGEIGETINIESRVHGSRGIPGDWRRLKKYGGGMVLDWGVHLIDQMLLLIPEKIKKIYCELDNVTHEEVDDGMHLRLTFESGKRAHIEVSTYNFISLPRLYMQGTLGSARIDTFSSKCSIARMNVWKEKEVLPVKTAAGITKTMAPRDNFSIENYEKEQPVSDVHDFYRNLVRAIDGAEMQAVKPEEVRRVLQVIEACFESAETNRAIVYENGL